MNAIVEIINPEVLLTLTIKTSLILALTGLLSVLLQRSSAALRHWFWSVAFLGVLVFPILSSTLPAWQLHVLPTALNKDTDKHVAGVERGMPLTTPIHRATPGGQSLPLARSTEHQTMVANSSILTRAKSKETGFQIFFL